MLVLDVLPNLQEGQAICPSTYHPLYYVPVIGVGDDPVQLHREVPIALLVLNKPAAIFEVGAVVAITRTPDAHLRVLCCPDVMVMGRSGHFVLLLYVDVNTGLSGLSVRGGRRRSLSKNSPFVIPHR